MMNKNWFKLFISFPLFLIHEGMSPIKRLRKSLVMDHLGNSTVRIIAATFYWAMNKAKGSVFGCVPWEIESLRLTCRRLLGLLSGRERCRIGHRRS